MAAAAVLGYNNAAAPTVIPCPPGCDKHEACQVNRTLLQYYSEGVAPPSARMGIKVAPNVNGPLPMLKPWQYWKHGWCLASKATQITGDIVSHTLWGPRRPTWGIEMTLISSLMRDASSLSFMLDVSMIRTLLSVGGLAPLPSDALVTPVTFRVKRRRLRGILTDLDAKETGQRELSGEWVVGKKTWQRLQGEWKVAQAAKQENKQPSEELGRKTEMVVMYIHGGGYVFGSPASQRQLSVPLALHTDARVFSLDYRLSPESTFPGPLHDAVCGYLRLVEDLHIPAENIIISGDSAGGGLSLALLLYLRDNDYPMPAGAILMSPWVDLTMSCQSWDTNRPYDIVPSFTAEDRLNPIAAYLGPDTLHKYLMHPYASPIFADFTGLPPLLITAGDSEVFRDEITLVAHKASLAGVKVCHELYEDMVHVFQLFPFLEACTKSFQSMADFVQNTLPLYQTGKPQALTAKAEMGLETEMDTKDSLFIDTDGVATSVSVDGIKDRLEAEESESPSIKTRPTHARASTQYLVPHPEWKGVAGNAPSPSLRRNVSHGDIGQLVDTWNSGPANETQVYRQPNPPSEV